MLPLPHKSKPRRGEAKRGRDPPTSTAAPAHERIPLPPPPSTPRNGPGSPQRGNQPPAGMRGYFKSVPFSNPFPFPLNYDARYGQDRHAPPRLAPQPRPSPVPSPQLPPGSALPLPPRSPPTPSPALNARLQLFALPLCHHHPPAAGARGTSPASHPLLPNNGHLASASPAAPHHSPPPPFLPPSL